MYARWIAGAMLFVACAAVLDYRCARQLSRAER
jgi:hypothetical protein